MALFASFLTPAKPKEEAKPAPTQAASIPPRSSTQAVSQVDEHSSANTRSLPAAERTTTEVRPRGPRGPYQPHDIALQSREDFLALERKLGVRAIHAWLTNHTTPVTTLKRWSKSARDGTLPPPTMQRHPGAGRPAAYAPTTTPAVITILNTDSAATGVRPGPRQVKAAFAEQPRSSRWGGKKFTFSTINLNWE